jgi:L-alanine-DL-glutamate epimerase-like enolase superfamily enzyme
VQAFGRPGEHRDQRNQGNAVESVSHLNPPDSSNAISGIQLLPKGEHALTLITRVSIRRGSSPDRDQVELRTDSGLTGRGEGLWGEQALRRSPELVLGRSPFEMEAIFDDIAALSGETPGGLDIALWDLAAGMLARPVREIFGKPYRQQVAVRAFPRSEFLVEPLPAPDLDGYRRLKETSAVPIAVGPAIPFDALLRDFVPNELADLVVPDIARCGLTGLRRLAYYCWVFHVRLAVACSGSARSTEAAIQAACCFPPVTSALAAPEPFVAVPDDPGPDAQPLETAEPDIVLGA